MKTFANLLERLAFTPGRNARIRLLAQYFSTTPDPDRGYGLAALTGTLDLRRMAPALLKSLVAERVDGELFRLSYDFVGDLAETIALIWPQAAAPDASNDANPGLGAVVTRLQDCPKPQLPALIAELLDRLEPSERLALLKLATGNLRVGVSARLARVALAAAGTRHIDQIEEIWHGLTPPFLPLFAWLDGGPPPPPAKAPFRPVMLSTPITHEELEPLNPADYFAEWKWDGIRIQAVIEDGIHRLYSRSGDDISASFPDVFQQPWPAGVFDGELLIRRGSEIGAFADLQKRLGRKTVSKAMLQSHPAALRLYDVLVLGGQDLRDQPLIARRAALEGCGFDTDPDARVDLSPLLDFRDWQGLAALRAAPPLAVIEGVMLKRRDSPYTYGRPRGPWFKWKRAPMVVDAVLLYAQSGHGKRSGFYSDFTFGLWDGNDLVPVGKAYSGFTDSELRDLDRFVRKNTTQRFGPVRQLAPLLVVEVAFEGLNASNRHRSGLAMRFPRIARIRHDKPAAEADHLATLRAML